MPIRAVIATGATLALTMMVGVGCKQKTVAPALPGAATAAAPAAAAPDPCTAICERTRPLDCRRATSCREDCREMARVQGCEAEMAATLACFASQPLSSWACGDDGQATLKEGFCGLEQRSFAGCFQRLTARPERPTAR